MQLQKQKQNHFFNLCLKVVAVFLLVSFSHQSFSQSCPPEKLKEFKVKYFKLQELLNYSGKDTKYDPLKDKLNSSEHNKNEEYQGKIFESYLFKRYQNIVSKIAYIAGQRKKDSSEFDKNSKLDSEIISFFDSIDDESKKIQFDKIGKIADKIAELSNSLDSKYKIDKEEVYLLKNLLIHAEDTKCRQEFLEDKKSRVKLSHQDEQAVKVAREKPINILLDILRRNKQYISPNYVPEELVFVDQEKAISESVQKHLEDLKTWLRNPQNSSCATYIQKSNGSFLKNDIQVCNFNKFISSLLINDKDFKQIESILHFINANESGPRKNKPIAETGLNETYFQQKFKELKIVFDWKQCVNEPDKNKELVNIKDTILQNRCICSQKGQINSSNKCEPLAEKDKSEVQIEAKPTTNSCEEMPLNSLKNAPWIIKDNSCTCTDSENKKCCEAGFILSQDSKSCVFDVKSCGEDRFVDKEKSFENCACKTDIAKLDNGKCVENKTEKKKEEKNEEKPVVEKCKPEGIEIEAIVEANWFKKDNKCICEKGDGCCQFEVKSKDGNEINNKSYMWNAEKNSCFLRALPTGGGGKGKGDKEEPVAPMYTAPDKTPPAPYQPRMIDINGGGFTTSGQR